MTSPIDERIDALTSEIQATAAIVRSKYGSEPSSKAAAILNGASRGIVAESPDDLFLTNFGKWKYQNDYEAGASVKAVLGDTGAHGQYIIPNNVVADVVERVTAGNVWRQVLTVVDGIGGKAVDIPYEADDPLTADLSSFGSNKTIADFNIGQVTAAFYTIAQIVDLGNQFLRQSNGAGEKLARSRLARAMAKAEQKYIVSGSGSSQPYGLTAAFGAYGGTAFDTTLSSESRAAAIGRALGALETRGATEGIAVVLASTDFYEMAVETLGTSGSGGWAFSPAQGPATSGPALSLWGIPVYRDPLLTAGTGYAGAFKQVELYFGQSMTLDVSSEANTRWDKNVTGFRLEEDIALDFRPAVFSGYIQRVIGL